MDIYLPWHQLVGVCGTLLYLVCYFLTQTGTLTAPGYLYSLLNMLAACLVGISLLYDFNLASALIQVSWIVISLFGVIFLTLRRLSRYKRKPRRPYALHRAR